jgi:DNA-binding transcriptional ArsR family regulator
MVERVDDTVWKALANATRREILDLLQPGPLSTGDLADRFPDLSRFAVMQHLKVLEAAELVISRKDGRTRYNFLNPIPIQMIHDRWVAKFQRPWAEALVSLKEELEARGRDDTESEAG